MQQLNLTQSYFLSPDSKNSIRKLISENSLKFQFDELSYIHDADAKKCRLLGYGKMSILADSINAENRVESVAVLHLFYPSFAPVGYEPVYIQSAGEILPVDEWRRTTVKNLIMFERSPLIEIIEVIDEQEHKEFGLKSLQEFRNIFGAPNEIEIPKELFDVNLKQHIHCYLIFRFQDHVIIIEKMDTPKTFEIHFKAEKLLNQIRTKIDDDTGKNRYKLISIS